MITTRASTVVLLTFLSCNQPVEECPVGGCVAAPLTLTETCARELDDLHCDEPKRCGLADPAVSCEAINKNTRSASAARCSSPLEQAVDAGRLKYDGAAARDCAASFETQTCFARGQLEACARVFTGLQPLGADCFTAPECVSGAWCDQSATCPGRCVPLVGAGAFVPSPLGCTAGLAYVDQNDGGWVCRAAVGTGEVCSQRGESVYGRSCREPSEACSRPGDGGVGVCEPWRSQLQPRGATCGLDQLCQRGLGCRFVAGASRGRCDDLIPLGQSCERDFNGCAVGAMCGRDLRCVPEPVVGEACTSTCVRGSRCVNSVCVAEGGVGAACPCEFGLRCVDGRCEEPLCR